MLLPPAFRPPPSPRSIATNQSLGATPPDPFDRFLKDQAQNEEDEARYQTQVANGPREAIHANLQRAGRSVLTPLQKLIGQRLRDNTLDVGATGPTRAPESMEALRRSPGQSMIRTPTRPGFGPYAPTGPDPADPMEAFYAVKAADDAENERLNTLQNKGPQEAYNVAMGRGYVRDPLQEVIKKRMIMDTLDVGATGPTRRTPESMEALRRYVR